MAHSCEGNGFAFYPKAYRPSTPAFAKDVYSYKNGGVGFRIGGSVDIGIDGGVLSDNMEGGVESSGALKCESMPLQPKVQICSLISSYE